MAFGHCTMICTVPSIENWTVRIWRKPKPPFTQFSLAEFVKHVGLVFFFLKKKLTINICFNVVARSNNSFIINSLFVIVVWQLERVSYDTWCYMVGQHGICILNIVSDHMFVVLQW